MSQLKVLLTLNLSRALSSNIIPQYSPNFGIRQLPFSDHGRSDDNSAMTTSEDYNSRKVQFSSSRSRDLMAKAIDIQNENDTTSLPNADDNATVAVDNDDEMAADSHLDSYDTRGNISLHSAMQTMVPEPYSNNGKRSPSHLNMPGGHVLQGQKYLSDDLHNTHYRHNNTTTTTKEFSTMLTNSLGYGQGMSYVCMGPKVDQFPNFQARSLQLEKFNGRPFLSNLLLRLASGSSDRNNDIQTLNNSNKIEPQLSQRMKMKRAIKDYGATVIVFHVSISLVSLGGFYVAVSSGLDVASILAKLPVDESLIQSKLAAGVGTFALAYAVHKVFAPVRMAITLASTPFIVRYLRQVGILKPPRVQ